MALPFAANRRKSRLITFLYDFRIKWFPFIQKTSPYGMGELMGNDLNHMALRLIFAGKHNYRRNSIFILSGIVLWKREKQRNSVWKIQSAITLTEEPAYSR